MGRRLIWFQYVPLRVVHVALQAAGRAALIIVHSAAARRPLQPPLPPRQRQPLPLPRQPLFLRPLRHYL